MHAYTIYVRVLARVSARARGYNSAVALSSNYAYAARLTQIISNFNLIMADITQNLLLS